MNITELKKTSTDLHVKVNVPVKDIELDIEKELKDLTKTARIDGFRVGKVPASILKKKYGASLRADVVKNKITNAINEVVKDKNLRILTEPEIDDLKNEENKDLEFILKYQLIPEIPMPDFTKISIEKPVLELKDTDIDEEVKKIAELSKDYATETKVKAKQGDQVTIDAVGYVDDKAFEGGKLEGHKLVLGSGTFIPGFEDQLIGCKKDEDVTVNVNFPEYYHEKSLAGKPSEFKVKVLAVHKESPVKIDDDFAKKFNLENLEKLKEQVAKNIHNSYAEQINTLMKMELFDQLEDMMRFDVPEKLLNKEVDILKQQLEGSGDEDFLSKSKAEQEKYCNKLAARRVRVGLMLAEYVRLHNLQIQKDDVSNAIMAQARNFPGREKEIFDFYLKNPDSVESFKGPILEDKAVEEIFKKEIKLKEKSYTKDKLEKFLAQDNEFEKAKKPKKAAKNASNEKVKDSKTNQ